MGDLQQIHLSHDNRGEDAYRGWKCSHVVIIDHTTGIQYPFIVNRLEGKADRQIDKKIHIFIHFRWLAVDEEDGAVERTEQLSTRRELRLYKNAMRSEAKHQLRDGHLWLERQIDKWTQEYIFCRVSIFTKPARSRFTRLQRVNCAIALIATSLLASCMWYDKAKEKNDISAWKMGPMYLSPEQVKRGLFDGLIHRQMQKKLTFQLYIGLASALISFFPVFLATWFFRKARYWKRKENHVVKALKEDKHLYIVSVVKSALRSYTLTKV